MNELKRRHPGLHVEFVMSDRSLDLGTGDADVAIRAQVPKDETLFGRKIADSQWGIYASRSYVERNGRIARIEDIGHHAVVMLSGELRDHPSVRWLKTVAPHAKVAAHSNSMTALLMAVKSGAGLAPMPVIVGEGEKDLVRVFGPLPELTTPFYLLMHQDMRRTPRVRAFFDFVIENLRVIEPLLNCRAGAKTTVKTTPRRKAPRERRRALQRT